MVQALASLFGSHHSFLALDIPFLDLFGIFVPEYSAEFYIQSFSWTPCYRLEWKNNYS